MPAPQSRTESPTAHPARPRGGVRASVAAAVVACACAFPAVASAHHTPPTFPTGGPRLTRTHDQLRAHAAQRGCRVYPARAASWTLMRRRTAAYWRCLHPDVVREHRMREHWPYPDWWVAYSAKVVSCESGHNPRAVSGDGVYRGLFQFDLPTWASVGGTGDPAAASVIEQRHRGYVLWSVAGPGRWPVCGRLFGR